MKKTTSFKKLLSVLVCLSMLCTILVFPNAVSAATSATVSGISADNGVSLNWNKSIRDNGNGTYTLTLSAKTEISKTILNRDIYTAENGYYVVPEDGKYIVQAWGSNGGKGSNVNAAIIGTNMKEGGKGGKGGYVEGVLDLKKGQIIAYTVGSNGSTTEVSGEGGGVNGSGGSHGGYGSYAIGGGGGYTAVYIYEDGDTIDYEHTDNYILIAGGGGGGGAGHRDQIKTADGGDAGDMRTSASDTLTADQNHGVAGRYYAGSNGISNSNNDDYVGRGATNLPGEANSTVWGWMSASAGNDWLATTITTKAGGLGGDGNGRGGAGGAGFAGGGGGIQHNIITASDCGGGGGGSSFIAASVGTVDETYRSYMATENESTTGGSVVITSIIGNVEEYSALSDSMIVGSVSEYFDIVSGGNVNGKTFSFTNIDIEPTISSGSTVTRVEVVVKPREGFAGGNNVPLLENLTVKTASNDTYTFDVDGNPTTDNVNVPWTQKITAKTIYASAGDKINTADLYEYSNVQDKVGTDDNYSFIANISDCVVEGIDSESFAAPEETTRYNVSYTVKGKTSAAKVGTPVDCTVSATAVVDVSGFSNVPVDGANNGYNKTLKYNSDDNTYDLIIEHTVSAIPGSGSEVTYYDTIAVVGSYTGNTTHTIKEDGYYLILLRGADGGNGGDACTISASRNHKHGFGGIGAAGSHVAMIGEFATDDTLVLNVGAKGADQPHDSKRSYFIETVEVIGKGGLAGGYTSVRLNENGQYLAIAQGGAGGGGSYSLNALSVGSINGDEYKSGSSAAQNLELYKNPENPNEIIYDINDISLSTNGKDGYQGSDKLFEAGTSAASYVYWKNSIENFSFTDHPEYQSILDTDVFKNLIRTQEVAASAHTHGTCSTYSNNDTSRKLAYKNFAELGDTPGVKIYKITRTVEEVEHEDLRKNFTLGGEISKYFDIVGVEVTGAVQADEPVITRGGENETSRFSVSNITANTEDSIITYTVKLSPKANFLGGNDVPVLASSSEYATGLKIRRTDVTSDKSDDFGDLDPKDSSDYANVAIPEYEFDLETHDATIVKGDSVNVSELYDDVTPLPSDWTADFVQLKASLEGTNGADTVSPDVTTEYMLNVELAPSEDGTKAIVAQPVESIKASKPATIYVEYSVDYEGLVNITPSNTENAQYHESYTTILDGAGHVMPDEITVTMGDRTLTVDTDYTYDKKTGRVFINEGVIEDNLAISAIATVQTYDLTYAIYDKDGLLSTSNSFTYEIGETIDNTWANDFATEANKSTDSGYSFRWVWNTSDGKPLDTMPGHNVQVDGFYDKIAYTLTVNYVYEDGSEAAESFTEMYYWDDNYSVDSPVIDGYLADKPTVSGVMPKSDLTVTVTYTKLEPEKYPLVIYYKYEDGTDAAPSYSDALEEGETYNVASPSIKGYKADKNTVSGSMTTDGATITVTYFEDVTEVIVTFDAQGGNLGAGAATKTVLNGNSRKYGTLPTPVKSGAKFLGWFTQATGGTEVTSNTVVTVADNHTLYAHWEVITANVTYDANGGAFAGGKTMTVLGTYGEAFPVTGEEPTRAGYAFSGWYLDEGATTAFDTSVDFSYTSPRTLYAGWVSTDSASVIFKNNGFEVKKFSLDPGATLTEEIVTPPTAGGYFKGWFAEGDENPIVLDYYEKKKGNNSFTVKDNTDDTEAFEKTYIAEWYDANTLGTTGVSDARAQAVTLSNGKKAIRFLALIDSNYNDYQWAGFIISTDCPTPTIEAGYQYSKQGDIYKKVYAMRADGSAGWLDIAYLSQNTFNFSDGAGLLYTNLTIKDGNEDNIYYATPYIVNAAGEYVYGETRGISYNQLKAYDAAAAAAANN